MLKFTCKYYTVISKGGFYAGKDKNFYLGLLSVVGLCKFSPSAAGRIANWSTHSAIVTIVSQNNPYNYYIPEPYLISKWGPGPIVAHYQSLCPYYYGDTVYYYY
jgi:hypothetical protein